MRIRGCWRRVLFVAVAFVGWSPSRAATTETGVVTPVFLIFSGSDLWRNGGFGHGGLLWSPGGLDREGFTFRAVLSGGIYRYTSGALGNRGVTGRELTAQFTPGWRFKFGRSEFKIFAGADLQSHKLWPDDPSSGLRGGTIGARASFDVWTEPTPQTMFAADGSISTISRMNYSARIAAGWRMFDMFYLGPEAQAYSSEDYRQRRLGLHITGLRINEAEWSAAAGWARDTDNRAGLYVRIGVLTRM